MAHHSPSSNGAPGLCAHRAPRQPAALVAWGRGKLSDGKLKARWEDVVDKVYVAEKKQIKAGGGKMAEERPARRMAKRVAVKKPAGKKVAKKVMVKKPKGAGAKGKK